MPDTTARTKPPREDLFRALTNGIEVVRDTTKPDAMPTLTGHFAVFDEWTEINSMWEGNFLERIAPGAFQKTMREARSSMRVLFNHGQDPQIGDKVLGPITDLREDEGGARYEVPLLDTSYNRDLIPGLDAGLYGASFRFKVLREEVVDSPEPSAENPRGLPERTIKEAAVSEFGPVTFPAYAGATAGLRSLTDEFLLARFLHDPERLKQLLGDRVTARADMPSIDILNCMWKLGQQFIAAENDNDDADDRAAMQTILDGIEQLVKAEADEPADSPPDPPAEGVEGMSSTPAPGSTRAAPGHPQKPRRESTQNNLFWFTKQTQGA